MNDDDIWGWGISSFHPITGAYMGRSDTSIYQRPDQALEAARRWPGIDGRLVHRFHQGMPPTRIIVFFRSDPSMVRVTYRTQRTIEIEAETEEEADRLVQNELHDSETIISSEVEDD